MRTIGMALAGAVALTTACAREQPAADAPAVTAAADSMPATPSGATAALADASGNRVGQARISADSTGAAVMEVEVTGLVAGPHGIHVHALGSCEARNDTAFAAAGGHLNPDAKQHGLENPQGPHAGDTPGIDVGADGKGTARLVLAHATLTTILDADGAAVVVHEKADDQKTDPSGGSGGRVACGVILGS